MPGGSTKQFGYDDFFSMVTNQALDPAGNSIMSRAYTRNGVRNITAQETEYGEYGYSYDDTDQLTGVVISNYTGPEGIPTNEWFTYDAMGNRITSGKTTVSGLQSIAYTANSLNQYTNIVVSNSASFAIFCSKYSFDPNGNQLTHYRIGETGIETNYLVWNIEDRLSQVLDASSNVIANYYYDPFGRRLQKTVGTNVTFFVYADEGLVAEADSGGTITTTYGFNPGSLWLNNPLFQRTFTSSTNSIFFLTDHLGAPQRALNSSGMEAWGIVQEAFGRAETLNGSSAGSNLRFSSQYLDSESGLHWNTMRYYQSGVGRYCRRDDLGERAGLNLYGFVENSPDRRFDILGLSWWEAIPLVGTGIAWFAPPPKGSKVSDHSYEIDPCDCLNAYVAWSAEDECQQSLKTQATDYLGQAIAPNAVGAFVDVVALFIGLKKPPVGLVVSAIATVDGYARIVLIQERLIMIKQGHQSAVDYLCSCTEVLARHRQGAIQGGPSE